jgi:hypothetical protein
LGGQKTACEKVLYGLMDFGFHVNYVVNRLENRVGIGWQSAGRSHPKILNPKIKFCRDAAYVPVRHELIGKFCVH